MMVPSNIQVARQDRLLLPWQGYALTARKIRRPVTVLPRPGGEAVVVQLSGTVLRLGPE